jgi:hypothetical protein
VAERKKEETKTDEECGDAGTDQQTQMWAADGLALAPDFQVRIDHSRRLRSASAPLQAGTAVYLEEGNYCSIQ